MKFKQALVKVWSKNACLMGAKCLVIQLVTRMIGLTRFPLSLSTIQRKPQPRERAKGKSVEKEDRVELDPVRLGIQIVSFLFRQSDTRITAGLGIKLVPIGDWFV